MKIYNWKTGEVITENKDCSTIKELVEWCVKKNISLQYADLSDANLQGVILNYINLAYANLSGVNLMNANLKLAILNNVDLSGANLTNTNLSFANLQGANLYYVDLQTANINGTIFNNCKNLDSTNIEDNGLSLSYIKLDFQNSIKILPNEIEGLKQALLDGRVDGSQYEGECACLVGTLANNMGLENYKDLQDKHNFPIKSFSLRERWFMGIKKDDKPENSPIVKITVQWIDEVLKQL